MFPSLINCCTIDWYDRCPRRRCSPSRSSSSRTSTSATTPRRPRSSALSTCRAHPSSVITSPTSSSASSSGALRDAKSFLELIPSTSRCSTRSAPRWTWDQRLRWAQEAHRDQRARHGMQQELTRCSPSSSEVQGDGADAVQAPRTGRGRRRRWRTRRPSKDGRQGAGDRRRRQADLEAAMPALNNAVKALDALSKTTSLRSSVRDAAAARAEGARGRVHLLGAATGTRPRRSVRHAVLKAQGLRQGQHPTRDHQEDHQVLRRREFVPDVVAKVSQAPSRCACGAAR